MKIIITVGEEVLRELVEKKYTEISEKLLVTLDENFANLKPLHHNSSDPELQKFFIVETDADQTDSHIVDDLWKSGAITSAYIKSKDEPPYK